jgi:putative ABC transport system substrate-binding protein
MRVETVGLLGVLSLGFLGAPLPVDAEQVGKVYLIGILEEGNTEADRGTKRFWDGLREFGWVEGQNLRVEWRHADSRDQLPALAAELVQLRADLIQTDGTPATRAAKQATKTIPIVFHVGSDPVESGLVASLAHPGGNLTGFVEGEYGDKMLEILKEALPQAKHVAYPSGDPGPEPVAEPVIERAAPTLGVEVHAFAVKGPDDFDRSFAAARSAGADAVLVPNVAWFFAHWERITAAAATSRLPAIGPDRKFARSGGLLSCGPKRLQALPRLAAQIDKILKGTKPTDLPVEQPTKFDMFVNLKAAKALGLELPPSFLARADEVIE